MPTPLLPENLTLEQINELRIRLTSTDTKKKLRKATLEKYHKSEKGKKKRSEAQMKYYWKMKLKKQKKQELKTQIDKVQSDLDALHKQLSEM
tara:strand:- start:8040 stop:8315 length:276 start_codon:yes stop_codon:yes gene_type:complete